MKKMDEILMNISLVALPFAVIFIVGALLLG